ncbi:MAG TPA: tannase/feruloyl esterase family alpha/beta hydrolase, partial [Blastocatellia bacterium]|nr:tannase/feruloyl esterase family alpha/beta hydrolase [Blastocatellia bacterium]
MRTGEGLRPRPLCNAFSATLFAALTFSSTAAVGQTCEKLADLKLTNTTITSSQSVAAGAFAPPTGSAAPYKALPAFCRVTGVIKPTSDSDIKFEVWMPSSGWNGKFQGIGNGGFAGSISYGGPAGGLGGAVARGYA